MQGPEEFLGKIFWNSAKSRAMAQRSTSWNNEIPSRLIALRLAVSGENQTKFAAQIGLEVKRWNNFERGSPLSKEAAIQLVSRIPGLTLDWLFLGKEDGLPVKLQRELVEAGKATTGEQQG